MPFVANGEQNETNNDDSTDQYPNHSHISTRISKGVQSHFSRTYFSYGRIESLIESEMRALKLTTVDFFYQIFLFASKPSSVLFMSRKTDVSQGTIDDLTSELIHFYVFQAAAKRKFDIL